MNTMGNGRGENWDKQGHTSNTTQKRKQVSSLHSKCIPHKAKAGVTVKDQGLNRQVVQVQSLSAKAMMSLKWLSPPADFRGFISSLLLQTHTW